MASRASVEDKLSAIRAIRDLPPSANQAAELRRFVGDRSNLVVAAAATLTGERTLSELAAELEAAFDRFLVDPIKTDKLCRAKLAIVQALDKMEHHKRDVFEKAARYVQLEPGFGAPTDTAVPLRGAALFALARIGGADYHCLLVDALTDTEKDVRIAAAQALAYVGTEGAALVLRLKARLEDAAADLLLKCLASHNLHVFEARVQDADADVLSECFSGLLLLAPEENLEFVSDFLDPMNSARCEAAAIALGKTRLPGALEALKNCWQRSYEADLKEQILLAIAMMRLSAATDFLVELVRSDSEASALAAISALAVHRYDPRLRERLALAVEETGSRALQARFDRAFAARI